MGWFSSLVHCEGPCARSKEAVLGTLNTEWVLILMEITFPFRGEKMPPLRLGMCYQGDRNFVWFLTSLLWELPYLLIFHFSSVYYESNSNCIFFFYFVRTDIH